MFEVARLDATFMLLACETRILSLGRSIDCCSMMPRLRGFGRPDVWAELSSAWSLSWELYCELCRSEILWSRSCPCLLELVRILLPKFVGGSLIIY